MDETALDLRFYLQTQTGRQGTEGREPSRLAAARWVGGLGGGRGAGDTRTGRGRLGSTRRPQQCTTLTPLGSCCEHAGPAGSPSSSEEGPAGSPHTRPSCGAAGGGRSGQVCAAHGRTQSGPASLGLSRGGRGTGQGFGACGPAAGPGRWPLSPMRRFLSSPQDGSWGVLHFGRPPETQPRLPGPAVQAQFQRRIGCEAHPGHVLVTILPLEFFFLRVVGKYLLRPTHSD